MRQGGIGGFNILAGIWLCAGTPAGLCLCCIHSPLTCIPLTMTEDLFCFTSFIGICAGSHQIPAKHVCHRGHVLLELDGSQLLRSATLFKQHMITVLFVKLFTLMSLAIFPSSSPHVVTALMADPYVHYCCQSSCQLQNSQHNVKIARSVVFSISSKGS